MYTVGQKMEPFYAHLTVSTNINRFSKFFHHQNQETICNKTISIDPITPQMCRYTTLWNVTVLRITIKNKTTSATTHFKKINNRNNGFLSQLLSKKSYLTVFTSMFNVSALLLDYAYKNAMPLTNGTNQMLWQSAPLSDNRLLQLVDCHELSKLTGHLLKNIPNRVTDWI